MGGVAAYWLDGGGFRSDGGVVHGPVAKARWQKLFPPREDNTVPLTAHVVLVQDGSSYGLLDSGFGHHLSDTQRQFYLMERDTRLDQGLAELQIDRRRIDWVVVTHLHLDHAGGLLEREGDRPVPAFPNAGVYVQTLEAQEAHDETNRAHGVYAGAPFDRLTEFGAIREVDGDADVSPHVRTFLTGGHTRGHQGILARGDSGEALLHLGDLVITPGHVTPGWVSALDDYPLDSIRAKKTWLQRANVERWWVAFSHDPRYTAGRLGSTGRIEDVRLLNGEVAELRALR
jgi:glyoxylase-like metal-dependent hydrolase (beta-lactamase superfamily II)